RALAALAALGAALQGRGDGAGAPQLEDSLAQIERVARLVDAPGPGDGLLFLRHTANLSIPEQSSPPVTFSTRQGARLDACSPAITFRAGGPLWRFDERPLSRF